jgi:hypothetical protein
MATVTELDVIGYGFGDLHINQVLERWLETPGVTITIYDPHRSTIPPGLNGASAKISIVNVGLAGYFKNVGHSKESVFAMGRRQFLEKAREKLRQKRLSVWQPSGRTAVQ